MKTVFRANQNELLQMVLKVINKSKPYSLGSITYKEKIYTLNDIKPRFNLNNFGNLHYMMDWFDGRRVGLSFRVTELPDIQGYGIYEFDNKPVVTRQTWASAYPTYEALLHDCDIATLTESFINQKQNQVQA